MWLLFLSLYIFVPETIKFTYTMSLFSEKNRTTLECLPSAFFYKYVIYDFKSEVWLIRCMQCYLLPFLTIILWNIYPGSQKYDFYWCHKLYLIIIYHLMIPLSSYILITSKFSSLWVTQWWVSLNKWFYSYQLFPKDSVNSFWGLP